MLSQEEIVCQRSQLNDKLCAYLCLVTSTTVRIHVLWLYLDWACWSLIQLECGLRHEWNFEFVLTYKSVCLSWDDAVQKTWLWIQLVMKHCVIDLPSHTHIYTCTHPHIHMLVPMLAYTHTHTPDLNKHTLYVYIQTHICRHTHTLTTSPYPPYTHKCTHMHTYTHTNKQTKPHTHTCTHTHIH